jgi:hypothetical protein
MYCDDTHDQQQRIPDIDHRENPREEIFSFRLRMTASI